MSCVVYLNAHCRPTSCILQASQCHRPSFFVVIVKASVFLFPAAFISCSGQHGPFKGRGHYRELVVPRRSCTDFIKLKTCYTIGAGPTWDFPRGAMPGYPGSTELFCVDAREPLVHETWKNKMSPNPMNPYDQCLWAAGKTIHKRWRASPPCLGKASRPPGAARRPKIKDFPS